MFRSRETLADSIGVFCLCFALLAFEIISVRALSYILGSGYIYFVLALAMLGLSAAGSLLSIRPVIFTPEGAGRWLAISSMLVALSMLVANVATVSLGATYDAILEAAGHENGRAGVAFAMITDTLPTAVKLACALGLPYFGAGLVLSALFANSSSKSYGRLYAADLVGAAAGCLSAVLVMEFATYAASVAMPIIAALIGGCSFAMRRPGTMLLKVVSAGAVLVVVILVSTPLMGELEPSGSLHITARDYRGNQTVNEPWRRWNSFTRVSSIDFGPPGAPTRSVMALASGDGHATLVPYDPGHEDRVGYFPADVLLSLGQMDDALVLFAGAGADMQRIYWESRGHTDVTGVELNRTLVDGALARKKFHLSEFFALSNVHMAVEEGRSFLERDKSRYDGILLSWSGATASYYAGAVGATQQFIYTFEGMTAILDHLKPGGRAVYLQVNKVDALAAYRRYFERRGLHDITSSTIVLYDPHGSNTSWRAPWDNNALILKPDGFSREDVAAAEAFANRSGLAVAYAPGRAPNPDFLPYAQVLTAPDLDTYLASLSAKTGFRFSVVTDDRPFYLDLVSNRNYTDGTLLEVLLGRGDLQAHELLWALRVRFIVTVAAFGMLLILAPLLMFAREGLQTGAGRNLAYFSALGAGFMFVEIGLMHRFSLLLGHPGLSIAVVLAGLVLSAGIGSLLSSRLSISQRRLRIVSSLVVLAVAIFTLVAPSIIVLLLPLGIMWRVAAVILLTLPLGIPMGQLFPMGLAEIRASNPSMVPWGWAINGALGTAAAGIAPLVAQAAGFTVVLGIGAAFYGLIILFPAKASIPSKEVDTDSARSLRYREAG
jgi:hypothetical protein